MSGASVPRTEKQHGNQTDQILRINLGSTYFPTNQRGDCTTLGGGARDTHLSREISLGNSLPSERPSFEMSERTSRIAQNRVPYVPDLGCSVA